MKSTRSFIMVGVLSLLLGVLLVTQFRSQRQARADIPVSTADQATYISQLYDNNSQLRAQVNTLSVELMSLQNDADSSKLASLERELETLRMANGESELSGPGVTVLVEGDITVFELQDLANELRNASAEVLAINGRRVVVRSAIVGSEDGSIMLDGKQITRPFRLEAIGAPDTLAPALERKGGLVSLLQSGKSALQISVTRHETADRANWLHLPKTTRSDPWVYAQVGP